MTRDQFADALRLLMLGHPISTVTVTLDQASARQLAEDLRFADRYKPLPDRYDKIHLQGTTE